MPKNFPYDLPLPNDANIVGSIAGYSAEYVLLFDTNLTPEAIQEFYAAALVEKGWHVAPTIPELRGFISQADIYSVYCTQEYKSSLRVETPFVSEFKRGIRLSLDTASDNGGQIAKSNWTLKDEQGRNWHGSLTISKTTTESDFLFAVLRIEKAE